MLEFYINRQCDMRAEILPVSTNFSFLSNSAPHPPSVPRPRFFATDAVPLCLRNPAGSPARDRRCHPEVRHTPIGSRQGQKDASAALEARIKCIHVL